MTSNEVWMGSGTSVTMAYESDLFLGYMNPGPTMGLEGTKEANYVRFNVGYEADEGNWSATTKEFSDYYELVPDLYTGCTAEFYWTEGTGSPTLQLTAMVAGNDKTGLFFAGQKGDYPSGLFNTGTATPSNPRGYIILKGRGATIPAPISMRRLNGASIAADDLVEAGTNVATTFCNAGDRLYNQDNALIGVIHTNNGADITFSADTSKDTTSQVAPALGKQTFVVDGSLVGTVQAGDAFTLYLSSKPLYMGQVLTVSDNGLTITTTARLPNQSTISCTTTNADATVTMASTANVKAGMTVTGVSIPNSTTVLSVTDGTTIELSQNAADATNGGNAGAGKSLVFATPNTSVYKGSGALVAGTEINVPHIRTLSDNWIGLTNSVTPPSLDIEMKQMNLALAGTRNWTYQYKGLETAGEANIDVNLNHGSWLYYALGNVSSVSLTKTDKTHSSPFVSVDGVEGSTHKVYAGFTTDADRNTSGHTANGKFHRVLKGTSTLCPPLLPLSGAALLTTPNINASGIGENLITYTFTERNDATLPSFSLELTQEKGSNVGSIPMTDTNTYNQTVYSQIYPGCMVNSFTLSANENEEVKSTMGLNVKRIFETPNNYVSKAYDATNNDTTEFKRLFNFGQLTGQDVDVTESNQSMIDPFYFSDGTISLFGADFMKVSSMTLTINNSITDKRYVGQYNKQIKHAVPAQRTYELSMQALVTDRRIFDELRRQSPHRFALNAAETDNTKHALIQLLFTKDNGESIKLQFDDYMISANTWPIPDDKGVITVDFTIMPIRIGTMEAISSWVMQN